MERFLGAYSKPIYAIMRIVVGLLFASHGAQKLLGLLGGWRGSNMAAPFLSQPWFAGAIEFVGGLLIAVGLLTGYAAFIASGEMAWAYFQSHFPRDFLPILNRGDRAVFYCFIFLYIASRGYVVWGLDSLFRRSKGVP